MTENGSGFRISDADRMEAMDALAEHMRTGRLDIAEYDERTARVASAKTVADLRELFVDVPSPKPAVLQPAAPQPAAPRVARPAPARPMRPRLGMIGPIVVVLAVLAIAGATHVGWVVFVVPCVVLSLLRRGHACGGLSRGSWSR